jgi:hypothetical protein
MTYPLNFWRIFATILLRLTTCDEKRAALKLGMTLRITYLPSGIE